MLLYQEIGFSKNTSTGSINIECNEDFNFNLKATGRLPRKKDLITAINRLYDEVQNSKEGWNKLNHHTITIKSNSMLGNGKIFRAKNRKDVWHRGYGKMREKFFYEVLRGNYNHPV